MIKKLDHINILCQVIDETVRFYTELFDMTQTPVPGQTDGGGVWLYDRGGNPIFHVQKVDPAAPEKTFERIRTRLGSLSGDMGPSTITGTGLIEHVALECAEYDTLRGRLDAARLEFKTSDIPSIGLRQIFVKDPNGIILELNFRDAA